MNGMKGRLGYPWGLHHCMWLRDVQGVHESGPSNRTATNFDGHSLAAYI